MKKILFVIPLLLISFALSAQEMQSKKGFISISIGPSFPLGDFASSDIGNTDAGFANNGLSINLINFGYLFSENFGITAMLNGSAYPFDADNGNEPIWSYGALLVGPLFSTPLDKEKADLDLRFMVGTLTAILDPDNGNEEQEGSAGAISIGAGIRYHLSDKISLATGLDYISSNPEFEVNGNDFNQSVASLNLTFGISFRLN